MRTFDFDPTALPAEILQALGFLVACSAQTEGIIQTAICGCLGVTALYGPAITAHMTAPLRDNVLRSVAQIRIDDLDTLDELDDILDGIKTAIAKRNLYVHGTIGRDEATGQFCVTRIESRGEVDSEAIPTSAKQIRDDATEILQCGLRLISFLMKYELSPRFPTAPIYRGHKSKTARKKRRKELLRSGKS
jgi:hypothetical protein